MRIPRGFTTNSMNKVFTIAFSGLVTAGCGGGGGVTPSPPTPVVSTTPTPPTAPTPSTAIPFMVCAEWVDANWTVTFQGQTVSGGGAADVFFPGKQCFRFSAASGRQTLVGTMRITTGKDFGAFAVSVAGITFPGPGPVFGSVQVITGPPGSFENYCYVSWATYPFSLPVNSTSFSIQFTMSSTASTSVCPA